MPVERRSFVPLPESWPWSVIDPGIDTPVVWLRERFPDLVQALQNGKFSREAVIIPKLGSKSRLASVEIDGGRDAKLVVIYARQVPANWMPGFREVLTYGPAAAGTDLIYDLTGEFMQGKARPFLADFRELPLRVYAVLPFQMEQIDLAAQQQFPVVEGSKPDAVALPVRPRFLDGRGEAIQGRLPYCLEVRDPDGKATATSYRSTQLPEESPETIGSPFANRTGRWTVAVRSLLTGEDATLPIDVSRAAVPADQRPPSLTRTGLQVRHVPRPVKPGG